MTRETLDGLIDAITEVAARFVLRVMPIILTLAATVAVTRGFVLGKIPLEGAVTQLSIVYAACGAAYGVNVLIKAKTATTAADRRLDANTPGLPTLMAKDVGVLKQAEQTKRESGETKIGP